MSQCEYIISSAMHGLIAADALGIPNIQLVASDRLIGGMYKFNDYYSSYSGFDYRERQYLSEASVKEVMQGNIENYIVDHYLVAPKEVLEKQEQLFKTFPYE